MIVADYKTAKGLVLLPAPKVAIIVDSEKIKDQIDNPMAAMFEMIRCLVPRATAAWARISCAGQKEIGGRAAVGFFTKCSMGNMTLWADPHTAKPIRIELDMPAMKTQGVLDNFRYDVPLDSALFSLKPPAGYLTLKMGVAAPAEDGLMQDSTHRRRAEKRHVPARASESIEKLSRRRKPPPNPISTRLREAARSKRRKSFSPLSGSNRSTCRPALLPVAEARERGTLRRRRREVGDAQSADLLVPAQRLDAIPRHLRRSPRQADQRRRSEGVAGVGRQVIFVPPSSLLPRPRTERRAPASTDRRYNASDSLSACQRILTEIEDQCRLEKESKDSVMRR